MGSAASAVPVVMDMSLEALLAGLAQRAPRVEALQTRLTAFRALGPENGGHGEQAKTQYIADCLTACGIRCQTRLDAPDPRVPCGFRPNLVARLEGAASRALWLFGHTDVVPPGDAAAWDGDPWQARREGDMIFGRGVEDNQQAIVSMLLLAEELRRLAITPRLSLGLVFMADEETGSAYGLCHILQAAPDLFAPDDLFVVPDAGCPAGDRIEVAEKGQLWLKVRVQGRQCHASTPQKGRNAFLAASAIALALDEGLRGRFPGGDALFDPPSSTFVPGKHEANVPNINTVPGADTFYVDCRLLPGVDADAVLSEAARIAVAEGRRRGVEADVSVVYRHAATATPADSPVVDALCAAVRAETGVEARPVGIGGASVAAFLRERGLPAAVWSHIENTCHAPNERSSIAATLADARVFARILMARHA